MADVNHNRPVNVQRIKNLLANGQAALQDAGLAGLSIARCVDAAYDATLGCALALAEATQRVATKQVPGHHEEVLLTMVDILRLPQATEMLNVMRRFRHSFKYDGNQQVTAQTAKDVRFWANRITTETYGWFEKNRPNVFKM